MSTVELTTIRDRDNNILMILDYEPSSADLRNIAGDNWPELVKIVYTTFHEGESVEAGEVLL